MNPAERFSYLPRKQRAEIVWWANRVNEIVAWYEGRPSAVERPSPAQDERETRYSHTENAIRTLCEVAKRKYLHELQVDENRFSGCRILDVGCGPIPHLHCFAGTERYGVDQLVDEYKAIGFPLDGYDPPIHYLKAPAERMPVEDGYFDAVVSVNAIDHVDDFAAVAREIARVLKPGGILRMQVHYHAPTVCEPWSLNDGIVLGNFGRLGIRKIHQKPVPGKPDEKRAVWSTHD